MVAWHVRGCSRSPYRPFPPACEGSEQKRGPGRDEGQRQALCDADGGYALEDAEVPDGQPHHLRDIRRDSVETVSVLDKPDPAIHRERTPEVEAWQRWRGVRDRLCVEDTVQIGREWCRERVCQ